MTDEAEKIAEYIAQQTPGRPFVLLLGGAPGERDEVVTSDMTEADLLDTFRNAVRALEVGRMIGRHKRKFRRRPDA